MMDVTSRIKDQEPPSVAETDVINSWLRQEIEEEEDDQLDTEALEDRNELLSQLIDRKPLAESVFEDRDRQWYQITLSENELRGLEVVNGPDDEGWRTVAKGGLIESIAERILAAENLEEFDQEVPKDLTMVADIAEGVSGEEEFDELIISGTEGERPHIADGNHRAVGMLLHILQSGEYVEQPAYVGIETDHISSQSE